MSEIVNLEPRIVWEQFDAITQVPRPSKKEGKIIEFLVDFARKHNIEYKKDAIGNVVMRKPATPGFEDRPAVILQSHMDMVCEKNSDVEFDFDNDPIRTHIDGGWVRAEGTTLGADCGIGMAAALAVMIDPAVQHGPVEALFTVDEETGLTGAFELGEGMLTGKYLINLDSEDEGEIFIGCAGGIDTIATFRYTMEEAPKNYSFFRVDVSDLQGGHSGDDIDKGRVNSNKTVARLLWDGMQSFELKLSYFNGGNLRNAIPREAYAIFGIPTRFKSEFVKRYDLFAADLKAEFRFREPNFKITLNEMPEVDQVLDARTQFGLVYSLVGVPNGVIAMSFAMPGLVETSTNLASVKFEGDDRIVVTSSQRSSVESAKTYVMQMVESVFALAGADVAHSDGYPGWAPNPQSVLLEKTVGAYERLFGGSPRCVRSMPDWNAACSSRNTSNWRWFPSARRCAACIRPTRGSKSPRFPSSGICCSKCSRPSDPPANAANPATDARFTITAPSLRGRCRCGWCRGYSPAGLTTPVNLTTGYARSSFETCTWHLSVSLYSVIITFLSWEFAGPVILMQNCMSPFFFRFSSVISAVSSVMVRLPSGVFGKRSGVKLITPRLPSMDM